MTDNQLNISPSDDSTSTANPHIQTLLVDEQPEPDTQPRSITSTFSVYGAYARHPGQPDMLYLGQLDAQPTRDARGRPLALLFVLVILGSLLIGGGTVFTFSSLHASKTPAQATIRVRPQAVPSPDATLQAYCQAVKTANAQAIYTLLSQEAKIHTSLDDLQRTFSALNSINALGIKYSDCSYGDVHVSGSLAVAVVSLTISMTFAGQRVSNANPSLISLVLENNQWKVDFSSLVEQSIAQPTPTPIVPTPTATNN